MMMRWFIQDDGVYVESLDGRELQLVGVAVLVNVDGTLTIRVPARDVVMRTAIVPVRAYDMNDKPVLMLAISKSGLAISDVSKVSPMTAADPFLALLLSGTVP